MDTQALEPWGNTFLNAARGQQLMEDMSRMMSESLGSLHDLFEAYGRLWGMDMFARDVPAYWSAFLEAVQGIQNAFLSGVFPFAGAMMGYPSPADYQALLREYESLKERASRQEEEIRRIQGLLQEKLSDQGEGIRSFQNLMKRQTQQFQDMMAGFSRIFSEAGAPVKDPGEEEEAPKKGSRSRRKT